MGKGTRVGAAPATAFTAEGSSPLLFKIKDPLMAESEEELKSLLMKVKRRVKKLA